MNEMVARATKKYAEQRGCTHKCYNAGLGCMCYLEVSNLVREMREPTKDMTESAWAPLNTSGVAIPRAIWQTMIDEALK